MKHQPVVKVEAMMYVICITLALAIMCFILAPFVGCATQKPNICEGITDSLICEKISDPQVADVLLQLGNLELIKNGTYSKAEALEFLDNAEKFIQNATTYGGIVKFILGKLKTVPPELLILSQGMLEFKDVIVPISDTDRTFLLAHIAHQRAIVTLIKR